MEKKCLMVCLIALFILSVLTPGSVAAGQGDASQDGYGPLPEDLPGQIYGDEERGPGPGPYFGGYEWYSPDY